MLPKQSTSLLPLLHPEHHRCRQNHFRPVPLIWNTADLFMGIMATINLFAILLLTPFLLMLLKDYLAQLKQGVKEPVFKLDNHPKFKDKVKSDIW